MIYVDETKNYSPDLMDAATRRNGTAWCHLTADSLDELHAIAKRIGLRRKWFQDHGRVPHYDITPGKRLEALCSGAMFKPAREQARERLAERGYKTP